MMASKILFIALLVLCSIPVLGQNKENAAKKDSITLTISFVVEKGGSLSGFILEEMHCPNCSEEEKENITEEVIRTIKANGAWKKVKKGTRIFLPVKFEFKEEEENDK